MILYSVEFRRHILFFLQLHIIGKIAEEKKACIALYRTLAYHTLQFFLC